MRTLQSSIIILVLALCTGCGGPSTAPVTGVVTLDGQPVYPARVTFVPKTAEGKTDAAGRLSSTETGVDGSYSIEKVAVGENIVGVMMLPVDEDSEEAEDNEKPSIAGKPEKEVYEVVSGENTIDIKLTVAAAPSGKTAVEDDDD